MDLNQKEMVEEKHSRKLRYLKDKWQKRVVIPDMIRGVNLVPDMSSLPPEFSSEPRLYGGVQLDEDERMTIELPVNFLVCIENLI